MNLQGQDWNQVVLKQKHKTTAQKTSAAAVNAALRSGTWHSRQEIIFKSTVCEGSVVHDVSLPLHLQELVWKRLER